MKEEEIRPKALFEQYLFLSQAEAQKLDHQFFESIFCPGCGSGALKNHLTKNNYSYVICEDCGSVFCNPRPSEKTLEDFYTHSAAAKFWNEEFFPAVAEKRREKLFKKKALQIKEWFDEKHFTPQTICDVGAGYGIFLEELAKVFPNAKLHAIEPSAKAAQVCQEKGIETLATVVEKSNTWSDQFDLVISSEVIEHVYSTEKFTKSLLNLVNSGGYCLITGLGYEGFDILILQEKSNSIFPPQHINFLSIQGFEQLFQRAGFSKVEVITPGLLDADIVLNSGTPHEFIRVLAARGSEAMQEFQNFLQKHKLSSHIWVLGQK